MNTVVFAFVTQEMFSGGNVPKGRDTKNNKGSWIIILDEDVALAGELKTALEGQGYRVLAANTFQDSLRMLANQQFSCIVLSYQIGNGSSVAEESAEMVLAAIRKHPNTLNFSTPIILTSSHLDAETLQKLGKSVKGAILKPLKTEELVSKINKLCSVT
jgi:CheY-like chemotaxis protein